MSGLDLSGLQQGIAGALRQLPSIEPAAALPNEVWASIRSNSDLVLGYVKERTGKSGDELLREVDAYTQAMKARYG